MDSVNWNSMLDLCRTTLRKGVIKASPTTQGIPANGLSNTSITKAVLVKLFEITQVSLLSISAVFFGENKNKKQKSAIELFDFSSLFSLSFLIERLSSFSCVASFVHMMVIVYGCCWLHEEDEDDVVFDFSIKYPFDCQIVALILLGSKYRAYNSQSFPK